MGSRLLQAWGAIIARRWLIQLITTIVVLVLACCITVFVLLLPIDEDLRLFVWLGCFVAFLVTATLGVLGWGLAQRSQRGGQFDAAFGQFGLQGRGYLTVGRQYHGSANGRQVDIYFHRGPQLDLYVSANTRTRLGVGRKDVVANAIRGLANVQSLNLDDPELASFNISAHDERWAREYLAVPAVKAAILRLLTGGTQSAYEIRSLILRPDGIELTQRYLPVASITPESARTWLNDLFALAQAAERLPITSQPLQASALELRSRTNRDAFTLPVVIGVLGFLGISAACVVGIVLLIIYLESGG